MSKELTKNLSPYDSSFLHCIDNKCYMCNRDRTTDSSVRTYFKYSHTKLKVYNSFTSKSKAMSMNEKFQEVFFLCDSCRVYWDKMPESKISNWYYRKFFQAELQKRPGALEKRKKYDRDNYLKKLEKGGKYVSK